MKAVYQSVISSENENWFQLSPGNWLYRLKAPRIDYTLSPHISDTLLQKVIHEIILCPATIQRTRLRIETCGNGAFREASEDVGYLLLNLLFITI